MTSIKNMDAPASWIVHKNILDLTVTNEWRTDYLDK